jgi:hypothetical protein
MESKGGEEAEGLAVGFVEEGRREGGAVCEYDGKLIDRWRRGYGELLSRTHQ